MNSKEEIFAKLKETLIELFQFDEQRLVASARISDDLDFDSIDVIDLVHRLEEVTDWKIEIEHFKEARTLGDVVDAVHRISSQQSSGA